MTDTRRSLRDVGRLAAVAHFEQVHRTGVALSQVLSDADEILAQSDDDEPDDEDLPPAS